MDFLNTLTDTQFIALFVGSAAAVCLFVISGLVIQFRIETKKMEEQFNREWKDWDDFFQSDRNQFQDKE